MAGVVGYVGVGVAAYVVFLVAGLPAAVVLQHAELPPEAGWDQARGTVWAGGLEGPWWRGTRLDSLEWRFRPWRLALGEAAVQARLAAPGLELTGDVAFGLWSRRLSLSDWHGEGTGTGVARVLALPVGLEGGFRLDLAGLTVPVEEAPSGEGRLDWRDAAVTAGPSVGLGQVTAVLDDGRLGLEARGGEVEVDGHVELVAGPGYSLELLLVPTATAGQATIGLLESMAPSARRDGRHRLRHQGRFLP